MTLYTDKCTVSRDCIQDSISGSPNEANVSDVANACVALLPLGVVMLLQHFVAMRSFSLTRSSVLGL